MQGWRWRIFLALVVYVLAMAVWATRPWTDTHGLEAPDREPAFAEFACPSLFANAEPVRGRQILSGARPEGQTEDQLYAVDGTPCDEQGKRRVLFGVDLVAAGVGMMLLKRSGARHRAADERHRVQAVEASGS